MAREERCATKVQAVLGNPHDPKGNPGRSEARARGGGHSFISASHAYSNFKKVKGHGINHALMSLPIDQSLCFLKIFVDHFLNLTIFRII